MRIEPCKWESFSPFSAPISWKLERYDVSWPSVGDVLFSGVADNYDVVHFILHCLGVEVIHGSFFYSGERVVIRYE